MHRARQLLEVQDNGIHAYMLDHYEQSLQRENTHVLSTGIFSNTGKSFTAANNKCIYKAIQL